jgi:hypothetical protein
MIHALNRDGFDLTGLSEGSAHLSEVTLTGSLGLENYESSPLHWDCFAP